MHHLDEKHTFMLNFFSPNWIVTPHKWCNIGPKSCLSALVQGRDLTSENVLRRCMHLVDLAGSKRVDKSEVTRNNLKETQHINRSLSALECRPIQRETSPGQLH